LVIFHDDVIWCVIFLANHVGCTQDGVVLHSVCDSSPQLL
jgi:hypothetical protein